MFKNTTLTISHLMHAMRHILLFWSRWCATQTTSPPPSICGHTTRKSWSSTNQWPLWVGSTWRMVAGTTESIGWRMSAAWHALLPWSRFESLPEITLQGMKVGFVWLMRKKKNWAEKEKFLWDITEMEKWVNSTSCNEVTPCSSVCA